MPAEKTYSLESYNFSVELPDGWMRFNKKDFLLVTRDGVLLQNILIKRVDIEKPLENTKKKITKGMMPQEIAEVIHDNLSTDKDMLNFEIKENIPVAINEKPGFKLVYTYKTTDGLKRKCIYYGFLVDQWFYSLWYSAAERHYFEKDIKAFEKVFESFKLLKT